MSPNEEFPQVKGKTIPDKFKDDFGPYGPVSFDGYCGEPVAWGYKPIRFLGEDLFREVEAAIPEAHWLCLGLGNWVLTVKYITPTEAVEKYGPVSLICTGPRGGFKTATYGSKTFCCKKLDPRGAGIGVSKARTEVEK